MSENKVIELDLTNKEWQLLNKYNSYFNVGYVDRHVDIIRNRKVYYEFHLGRIFTYSIHEYKRIEKLVETKKYLFEIIKTKDSDSYQRIGKEYNLSIERVRQISNRFIREQNKLNDSFETTLVRRIKFSKRLDSKNNINAIINDELIDKLKITLNTKLKFMDFSTRTQTCFFYENNNTDGGLETIGDLIKYSKSRLLRTKNFGRKSLFEIESKLYNLGLKLKDEEEDEYA